MDSAIIPLTRYPNLSLIQTVDFFYPLIDHPAILGEIALANVVSDIYATGVFKIDKIIMIISSPTEMTNEENNTILPLIIQGFRKSANKIGCKVDILNIIKNPWCFIGGIATSICNNDEIIMPTSAKTGDLIILTKPIGTQIATNTYIWMQENNDKYKKILKILSNSDIIETYNIALNSMAFINKIGAELMHKYKASGATDVTGFGLLGHAKNLIKFQSNEVDFIVDKFPIIKNVYKISEILDQKEKLLSGCSIETSGGLFITLPADQANNFCNDYAKLNFGKHKAWIIGRVINGERQVKISSKVEILEICNN